MEKNIEDDKEHLIDEIIRLRKQVIQLQNIIKKLQNPNTDKNIGKQRDFDFSKHCVRHIALKILYLGWDYDGFASQEDTNKTIEAAIFNALYKTKLIQSRQTSNYHRCGRTDKGVSAFSQVISIDLRTNLKEGPNIKKSICISTETNKSLNKDDIHEKNRNYAVSYDINYSVKDYGKITNKANNLLNNIYEPDNSLMDINMDIDMKNKNKIQMTATQNLSHFYSNASLIQSNNLYYECDADLLSKEQVLNISKVEEDLKFIDERQGFNDPDHNNEKDFTTKEQYLNDAEVPYVRMLNKVLPDNIRIVAWAPVDDKFSARFSCIQRTYKYYLPASDLNIEMMQRAGNYLIGEHDFRNLCKMDVNNGVINYHRKILSFHLHLCKNSDQHDSYDIIEITIIGLAFLWHQIRCIISLLIIVGKKLEVPEIILELLDIDKNPRKPQYSMAADYPLVLFDCQYENINWIYKMEEVRDVIRTLQSKWTYFAVRTRMIKNMLENLEQIIEPTLDYQINSLLPSLNQKKYKPFLKREKCESLEDRIKMVKKKRKTYANQT